MWTSKHSLTIPMNQSAAAAGLWAIGITLMILEATLDTDGALARWAIIVAIAAATLTIVAVMNHARRVLLDVVSWEAQRTREAIAGDDSDSHVVSMQRHP